MKRPVVLKGINWSHNKLSKVPDNINGVFVIFNETDKTVVIKEHPDVKTGLREEFWSKTFWSFSWFAAPNDKERAELAAKLKKKSFDELVNLAV